MIGYVIRPAVPTDLSALYEICLETGDSGEDATALYEDAELIGHVWVGPYLALVPELAFVAVDSDGVAGYVLGCADTTSFEEACEREWWPALRDRYRDPVDVADLSADQRLHRRIHYPPSTPTDVVADYPAHLHIDLLPRVQGRGVGRRLIETLFDALRSHGVVGVHLGVDPRNRRAIGFYTRLGFHALAPDHSLLGRSLTIGR